MLTNCKMVSHDSMITTRFTTGQVAALTGLTTRQLDYWAQCGIFEPSIQQSKGPGTRKFYSTDDLIQLCSLSKIKCFRWSTQKIRDAIATVRDVMADSNPLRQAMLFGGKQQLFVVCKTAAGEHIIDALGTGKQQLLRLVLETLEKETRRAVEQFLNQK